MTKNYSAWEIQTLIAALTEEERQMAGALSMTLARYAELKHLIATGQAGRLRFL